ncbi:Calcium-Independent Phospholipase A2-Gamma [Manis pentadactyla]|nr:Calcium-Independent Phospholipase A2-Gamma [Manis pentadactyla]
MRAAARGRAPAPGALGLVPPRRAVLGARRRRSAPSLCASPDLLQVLGSSSLALFQPPPSHPPPARSHFGGFPPRLCKIWCLEYQLWY